MKHKYLPLILGALASVSLASCSSNPESKTTETKISGNIVYTKNFFGLEKMTYNLNLAAAEKEQIKIDSMPEGYALSQIKFKSLDENIATVTEDGWITAKGLGSTRIEVKSDDGIIKTYASVIVSAAQTRKDVLSPIVEAMTNDFNAPGYQVPTKFHKTEYSMEDYYEDGKVRRGYHTFEETVWDGDEGYFMVTSDDFYLKTTDGARDKLSGKWIFYCIDDMNTRMIRITPTSKSYIDLNTAAYIGKPHAEVIYSILDMFFVSGREIVTDGITEYGAKDEFISMSKYLLTSGTTWSTAGDKQIYLDVHDTWDEEITAEDEIVNGITIPTGTKVKMDQQVDYFFDKTRCPNVTIKALYDYTLDGVKMRRDFYRDMVFDTDLTYEKYDNPKDLGFRLAENVYDL